MIDILHWKLNNYSLKRPRENPFGFRCLSGTGEATPDEIWEVIIVSSSIDVSMSQCLSCAALVKGKGCRPRVFCRREGAGAPTRWSLLFPHR